MKNQDDLFDSMVKEAMEEVANHGWKNASDKAVTLAAFGLLGEKINRRLNSLVRPAWAIASSIGLAVIWWIVSSIFGIG